MTSRSDDGIVRSMRVTNESAELAPLESLEIAAGATQVVVHVRLVAPFGDRAIAALAVRQAVFDSVSKMIRRAGRDLQLGRLVPEGDGSFRFEISGLSLTEAALLPDLAGDVRDRVNATVSTWPASFGLAKRGRPAPAQGSGGWRFPAAFILGIVLLVAWTLGPGELKRPGEQACVDAGLQYSTAIRSGRIHVDAAVCFDRTARGADRQVKIPLDEAHPPGWYIPAAAGILVLPSLILGAATAVLARRSKGRDPNPSAPDRTPGP